MVSRPTCARSGSTAPARPKYEIERIGLNARLDTIQAAILLAKLPALDGEIAARQALAERYDAGLGDVVEIPIRPNGAASAWAQYSF